MKLYIEITVFSKMKKKKKYKSVKYRTSSKPKLFNLVVD